VIFSEEDQPGYKTGAWNRDRRVPKDRNAKQEPHRVSKKPYRSSIPKKTALAGFCKHEVTVTAVENDEYRSMMDARYKKLFQPKHTTTFTAGIDHRMHPGLATNDRFATFVASNKPTKGKKPQQEKAVRISENDLLDALHQCFREYTYWPLRGLRHRLKQPEAFIKANLEKIATLVRSGPYNGNWKLNDEYAATVRRDGAGPVKEEVAGEGESEDEEMKDEDGDEGDYDFEDVNTEQG